MNVETDHGSGGKALQICVLGSEMVAGMGDPRGAGWVGRLAAQSTGDPLPQFYPLAVYAETTAQLAGRWKEEVMRRFQPGFRHRLVIAPGIADLTEGMSLARSRLHLADILDQALKLRIPSIVVGPPPGPPHLAGRIEELSMAFADVAARRGIGYVDTFTPLFPHEQWNDDLATGDGVHPSQAGYGLIAWLVLHSGWHSWLGMGLGAAAQGEQIR
ncbi:MAG: GDSL-type esterase/lipase family protein [Micrococcales bacterium]|nr:GDSL-type esterase/lipase family protein [Micrococcales bacterium]